MQPTQPPTRGGSSNNTRPASHPGFEPESVAAGTTGAGDFDAPRQDKGSPDTCLSGLMAAAAPPDADRVRPESGMNRGEQGSGGAAAGEFADSARRQAQDLKGSAQHLAQDAKQKVGDFAQQLKGGVADGAQQATQQAKQAAAEAARMLRERGQDAFAQQKDRAAHEIGNISAAIHKAGDKLDQEKDHNIACVVHGLAEQVGRLSDYVRGQDLNRLLDDVQQFGRRRPEWMLGGMFVAGMALARFLKASSAKPHAEGAMYGGGQGYGSSAAAGGVSRGALTEPGMYSGSYVDARTGMPYDRTSYGPAGAGTAVHSGADALVRGNAGSDDLRDGPSMPQAPSASFTGESMATTQPASSSDDLAGGGLAGQLPSPATAVRGGAFVPTLERDTEPAGGGTSGAGVSPADGTSTSTGGFGEERR